MTENHQAVILSLDQLSEILDLVIHHLELGEEDSADLALTSMLMVMLTAFGPSSLFMQQTHPAMESIRTQVFFTNIEGAMEKALLFRKQLQEIRRLVDASALQIEGQVQRTRRLD